MKAFSALIIPKYFEKHLYAPSIIGKVLSFLK
jgi:hypothetical protein